MDIRRAHPFGKIVCARLFHRQNRNSAVQDLPSGTGDAFDDHRSPVAGGVDAAEEHPVIPSVVPGISPKINSFSFLSPPWRFIMSRHHPSPGLRQCFSPDDNLQCPTYRFPACQGLPESRAWWLWTSFFSRGFEAGRKLYRWRLAYLHFIPEEYPLKLVKNALFRRKP